MARRIGPILLVALFAAVAGLLVAHKQSPSRESLLPILRMVQQHEKQLDRAVSKVIPLSPEEERRIGEEMHGRIASAPPPPTRPERAAAHADRAVLASLARETGETLARSPQVRRFPRRYVFTVLWDHPYVNAHAIPGGYVYVTEGLLQRFRRNPGALAYVLAHEIGHVELGHCADMYRTREWFRKAGLKPIGDLAGFFRILAELHFSETQELEADLYGVRLMHERGMDPQGALEAMDLMGLTEQRDSGTRRGPGGIVLEGLVDYFKTHPGSWERRGHIRREIERLRR